MTKCMRMHGGKLVIWEKPLSGNPMDPFNNPVGFLSLIYFCSDFDYYARAIGATPTISHPNIPASAATLVVNTLTVNISVYTTKTTNDYLLLTHNLGYKPNFMVCDSNGNEIPHGWPIQFAAGTTRKITAYATTTEIRLKEVALYGQTTLPPLSQTYTVVAFRNPDPVVGAPGIRIQPSRVRFGYGKIDSNERSLRRALAGEATFGVPQGPTVDIKNGQVRFVRADGTIYDLNTTFVTGASNYGGSFTGTPAIPAVF